MTDCAVKQCCSSKQPMQNTPINGKFTNHKFLIRGMDCASCAIKIQNALANVAKVKHVRVAFATERLFVSLDEDADPSLIRETVESLGFTLLDANAKEEEKPFWKAYSTFVLLASLMAISIIVMLLFPSMGEQTFFIATAIGTLPFAKKSFNQMKSGTWFGIETLMTVAALGALFLGENIEAGLVLLLFSLGEMLEGFAGRKARAGIKSLMQLTPDTVTRIVDGKREKIQVEFVIPGEVIEVLPGDRIPVDATIQSSIGTFDESALTGESIPVNRKKDEKVMAGCMVIDKSVTLVVESEPGNNAIDRIITLIEEAEESRAPIARMVDKFSSWYTPLVMAIAALVMVVPPLFMGAEWMPWVYKALTLLLIACPCALVVSIPAAVTSALTSASRSGALIKGGAALEQLKNVKVLAFDKTGTLTQGKPKVTTIISLAEDRNELLKLAASLEQGSSHPLAKAIIEHSKEYGIDLVEPETIKVINGRGIIGKVDNREISILAPRYVHSFIMGMNELKEAVEEIESQGNTVVVILEGMAPLGIIGMADTLREDAVDAINDLKKMGIRSVMLTGDNRRAAASIAGRLSIDYKAELLPEDKVKAIQDLQLQNSGAVAMVGDGINDAPALKMAELGIAMGRGSDVALETADAALTHEKLVKLPVMIKLSQKTAKITRQNIALALGINSFFLITTLFGVTGLMAAVLSDAGGTLLVTLNALRLMKQMKIE